MCCARKRICFFKPTGTHRNFMFPIFWAWISETLWCPPLHLPKIISWQATWIWAVFDLLNIYTYYKCEKFFCVCVLSNSSAISCPIWLKFWTKLWIAKEQRVNRFQLPILSNFWFYWGTTFMHCYSNGIWLINAVVKRHAISKLL